VRAGIARVSCIIEDDAGNASWWFDEGTVFPVGALEEPIVVE
jgi:hypothetical protein